ncbi:hypothetical protein PoB_003471700 [Plakobranchus ocellatus]|uniref:Uncharacterized protein n=1 Tax=Plakobranchus ocellatus TaxID=259542 RepID=A0AAV4ALR8_9GAST|nr:hypothetical protein PoB_003471700 [Plakobranchus ocellatus]
MPHLKTPGVSGTPRRSDLDLASSSLVARCLLSDQPLPSSTATYGDIKNTCNTDKVNDRKFLATPPAAVSSTSDDVACDTVHDDKNILVSESHDVIVSAESEQSNTNTPAENEQSINHNLLQMTNNHDENPQNAPISLPATTIRRNLFPEFEQGSEHQQTINVGVAVHHEMPYIEAQVGEKLVNFAADTNPEASDILEYQMDHTSQQCHSDEPVSISNTSNPCTGDKSVYMNNVCSPITEANSASLECTTNSSHNSKSKNTASCINNDKSYISESQSNINNYHTVSKAEDHTYYRRGASTAYHENYQPQKVNSITTSTSTETISTTAATTAAVSCSTIRGQSKDLPVHARSLGASTVTTNRPKISTSPASTPLTGSISSIACNAYTNDILNANISSINENNMHGCKDNSIETNKELSNVTNINMSINSKQGQLKSNPVQTDNSDPRSGIPVSRSDITPLQSLGTCITSFSNPSATSVGSTPESSKHIFSLAKAQVTPNQSQVKLSAAQSIQPCIINGKTSQIKPVTSVLIPIFVQTSPGNGETPSFQQAFLINPQSEAAVNSRASASSSCAISTPRKLTPIAPKVNTITHQCLQASLAGTRRGKSESNTEANVNLVQEQKKTLDPCPNQNSKLIGQNSPRSTGCGSDQRLTTNCDSDFVSSNTDSICQDSNIAKNNTQPPTLSETDILSTSVQSEVSSCPFSVEQNFTGATISNDRNTINSAGDFSANDARRSKDILSFSTCTPYSSDERKPSQTSLHHVFPNIPMADEHQFDAQSKFISNRDVFNSDATTYEVENPDEEDNDVHTFSNQQTVYANFSPESNVRVNNSATEMSTRHNLTSQSVLFADSKRSKSSDAVFCPEKDTYNFHSPKRLSLSSTSSLICDITNTHEHGSKGLSMGLERNMPGPISGSAPKEILLPQASTNPSSSAHSRILFASHETSPHYSVSRLKEINRNEGSVSKMTTLYENMHSSGTSSGCSGTSATRGWDDCSITHYGQHQVPRSATCQTTSTTRCVCQPTTRKRAYTIPAKDPELKLNTNTLLPSLSGWRRDEHFEASGPKNFPPCQSSEAEDSEDLQDDILTSALKCTGPVDREFLLARRRCVTLPSQKHGLESKTLEFDKYRKSGSDKVNVSCNRTHFTLTPTHKNGSPQRHPYSYNSSTKEACESWKLKSPFSREDNSKHLQKSHNIDNDIHYTNKETSLPDYRTPIHTLNGSTRQASFEYDGMKIPADSSLGDKAHEPISDDVVDGWNISIPNMEYFTQDSRDMVLTLPGSSPNATLALEGVHQRESLGRNVDVNMEGEQHHTTVLDNMREDALELLNADFSSDRICHSTHSSPKRVSIADRHLSASKPLHLQHHCLLRYNGLHENHFHPLQHQHHDKEQQQQSANREEEQQPLNLSVTKYHSTSKSWRHEPTSGCSMPLNLTTRNPPGFLGNSNNLTRCIAHPHLHKTSNESSSRVGTHTGRAHTHHLNLSTRSNCHHIADENKMRQFSEDNSNFSHSFDGVRGQHVHRTKDIHLNSEFREQSSRNDNLCVAAQMSTLTLDQPGVAPFTLDHCRDVPLTFDEPKDAPINFDQYAHAPRALNQPGLSVLTQAPPTTCSGLDLDEQAEPLYVSEDLGDDVVWRPWSSHFQKEQV